MATAFAILLVLHASIHLLGAAKAFGWADLSQLPHSISQAQGVLWLASALLFTVAATALFVWPRGWWLIGAGAIAVSMLAIVPSWADAKAGAGVNGIVALGVLLGCMSQGPSSLRAEYEADVQKYASKATALSPVTEADLAIFHPRCRDTSMSRASSANRACRLFMSECTVVSVRALSAAGCRCGPSSTPPSVPRHACST